MVTTFLFTISIINGQNTSDPFTKPIDPDTKIAKDIFSSTRVVNGHSVKQKYINQLEFRISHRFGPVNNGIYELFGLDQSLIHFSLEYGVKDWFTFGIGRGNYEKTYDAFAKLLIANQSSGNKNFPLNLSFISSTELNTIKFTQPGNQKWITSRMAFVQQLLIARKFNETISFQLSPTFIFRNLHENNSNDKNLVALGISGRYRISEKLFFNAEYFYAHRNKTEQFGIKYYNPLSIGVDINTGGHVFQIVVSNSRSMRENSFIGYTADSWGAGGIHLGFNISRTFSFY